MTQLSMFDLSPYGAIDSTVYSVSIIMDRAGQDDERLLVLRMSCHRAGQRRYDLIDFSVWGQDWGQREAVEALHAALLGVLP